MKYNYLAESPVREVLAKTNQKEKTIFESEEWQGKKRLNGVRDILADISNVLTSMEEHREEPLRIAIMGEVKAGKSTFLNAVAGKKIAYTDVLEATAMVSEIVYAEEGEEYARVLDKEGNVAETYDFQELVEWMEEYAEDAAYFQQFSKVVLGVCNDNLRDLIVVDTPGLLSITEENHNTASSYIYQADYIFWVLNSNNLGDKDVNEKLNELRFMGKPMIGIVNQVDTPETLQEIESYVRETYQGIFDEIFFASSLKAWKGLQKNNEEWYQESGLEEIIDYMRELAEDGEATKESCCVSAEAFQLHRELEVHERIREDLKARKSFYDSERSELHRFSRELEKETENKLKYWLKNELFLTEKTNLMNADEVQLQSLLNKYASQEYITRLAEEEYQVLLNEVTDIWTNVVSQRAVRPTQVEIDFHYEADKGAFHTVNEKEQQRQQEEYLKKGVKTGATLGIALAGYAAWLGPAAVSIAFLPEAVVLAPVGAAIGLVLGKVTYTPDTEALKRDAHKKEKEVDRLYQQVYLAVEEGLTKRCDEIRQMIEHSCRLLCEDMEQKVKSFCFSFEEPEYSEYMRKLDVYLETIKKELQKAETAAVIPVNPSEYMVSP